MRIAVTASSPTLDADIDPRFGRCQYLIFVDPDTMSFEAVNNAGVAASGGAGISTAQLIAGKGVEAVLTGNCGPNAYQVLSAAGIKVITGVSGKVRDAVQSYKSGKLQASSQPNVAGHFGLGMGRGVRRGMGGR
ncbi:MAG: NifB/NifX family molybdenum-iron cluster-binding protein [Dehalococcoidia bacterium]|nr:NifB/NifX family molybdenum-iron cluster-binding protein [Dehalococcoidia bacterium]